MVDKRKQKSVLPFLWTLFRTNLLSAVQYRISFLGQVVFMMLNNTIFLLFWWLFFKRFDSVGSWQLEDMMTLFALAAIAFGLAATLAGNGVRLSSFIVTGGLDAFLTLPRSPLLHILFSRSAASAIGDVIFGLIVLFCFTKVSWTSLLLALIAGALGAVVFTSFAVIAHSLCFYLGSADGIGRMLQESLMTMSLYPEAIFSIKMRVLLYTIIPAGFMSYIPVHVVKEGAVSHLIVLALATVCWAKLAVFIFYCGLERYESGNLVTTRHL